MMDNVPTLVLGLGNPIMGDDGLGLIAVARLKREWRIDNVQLVDGGTWGMNLLPLIEEAERLLIVDAIDIGAAPGTLVTLEREEIPRIFQTKLSPHEVDLREVLALAELRCTFPGQAVAIGVQPASVDLSTDLTSPVAAAMDDLLARIIVRLRELGHTCERSGDPADLRGGLWWLPPEVPECTN